ncbi:hypothetical protein MNBD_GAMMA12-2137 [hydrothermal vent metagenome]|uniref:HEAT repeat domain-containing protein n=1 Tax=hydrothermal vent metagenome TaxID=652676 RepID=A0A3B0Y2T3_9ZZZZ
MDTIFNQTSQSATAAWLSTLYLIVIYIIVGLAIVATLYFVVLRNEKKRKIKMAWALLSTYFVTTLVSFTYTYLFPFASYSWAVLDHLFSGAIIVATVLLGFLLITKKIKLSNRRTYVKAIIFLYCVPIIIVGIAYGKTIYYSFQDEKTRINFYISELESRHTRRQLNATQMLLDNKSQSIGLLLQKLATSNNFKLNKKIENLLGKVGPDLIPELHKIASIPSHPAYNSAIKLILIFSKPSSWNILAKALYENKQLAAPVREQILNTLYQMDRKKTLAHIHKQMLGFEEALKSTAAKLLGNYPRNRKSIKLLNKALKDKSAAVCEYAADSLGRIKSKKSTAALLKAIRTRSDCDNALRVLSELRVRNAVPYLISRYKRTKDIAVKSIMLLNLGKVGDKRALPLIEKALKSDDEQIRRAAEIAAEQIKKAIAEVDKEKQGN